MKNLKLITKTSAGLLFAAAVSLLPAQLVAADSKSEVTGGVTSTGAGSSLDIPGFITSVVNLLSFVVGALAVIMIMVGGFKYVTSGGDSGKVTSAKNTIMYAIIGIVIVVLAQTIVQFVLDKL